MPTEAPTAVPDRTFMQRMDALQWGNTVRTSRANLKKDLKAGRRDVIPLIINPPDEFLTMRLFDLLLALPKLGRVKVNRILTQTRSSPSKTLGGLTERQRGEIIHHIQRRP